MPYILRIFISLTLASKLTAINEAIGSFRPFYKTTKQAITVRNVTCLVVRDLCILI